LSDISTISPSSLTASTSPVASNLFLLRYVRPAYIKNYLPTDEALQLREDRLPPEEYISFYESSAKSLDERFKDFIRLMNVRSFKLAKTSGILHVDTADIYEQVNVPRKLVEIKDCKKPHYGLFFCSKNEEDVLEAKTTLLFLADFELTNNVI
jgi:hypothetical protein